MHSGKGYAGKLVQQLLAYYQQLLQVSFPNAMSSTAFELGDETATQRNEES